MSIQVGRVAGMVAAAALMIAAGSAQAGDVDVRVGVRGRFGIGVSGSRMNISVGGARGFHRDRIPVVTLPVCRPTPPSCRPRPICPPVDCSPRGYSYGSGLSIGGVYRDDNFSIGARLGSVDTCDPRPVCYDTPVVYTPPVFYNSGYNSGYYRQSYYQPTYWASGVQPVTTYTNYTQPGYTQPLTTPAPTSQRLPDPPEPASSLEVGVLALQSGQTDLAASALRRHVNANPEDARAMRTLAVALLADKQVDDAGGMLRQAYRVDPKLAGEPLVPLSLGFEDRAYRDLVTRAVANANRANTGSAWLLVAALMQGEGRLDLARTMLERAKAQGLEPEVFDPLAAELR